VICKRNCKRTVDLSGEGFQTASAQSGDASYALRLNHERPQRGEFLLDTNIGALRVDNSR